MYRFGLAAAALLLSATAAQAVTPTADVQTGPTQQSIEAAADALGEFDLLRLTSDRAYAAETLRHIETLSPLVRGDPTGSASLEAMKALVLATLDRKDEARRGLQAMLRAGSARAEAYVLAWAAASHIPDPVLMVESAEAVSQHVAPAERESVFQAFDPAMVFSLDRELENRGLEAERMRLGESLVAMDWPGPRNVGAGDYFRRRLLDHRLGQNRSGDAAGLAREIRTPLGALPLLMQRRYEGLLGSGDDSAAHLERILAEADRATASALGDSPQDHGRILQRMEFLRGVGRDEDAVAVARPLLADVPATVAEDPQGMWILDNAAGALVTLGRAEEALAIMSRLVALDMADNPELIGPSINYVGLLWETGRHEEALAHADRLVPLAADYANDYGRMWIASYAACSNLALGRTEAAAERLRQLKAQAGANAIALNLALLCADDLDASEQLVVERLQADDPQYVLLALQDYRINPSAGPELTAIRERLLAVRDRPAVRAALERVGRVLSLPLSRAYFGTF